MKGGYAWHNIRVVCVGAREQRGVVLTPSSHPQDASCLGRSDWSTLFKMASSLYKIRFISIAGKGSSASPCPAKNPHKTTLRSIQSLQSLPLTSTDQNVYTLGMAIHLLRDLASVFGFSRKKTLWRISR